MAGRLQVQYAFANIGLTGPQTIVAAQPGQAILVLQMCVISSLANNVKFQSSTGPTDISALFPLAQNGGFVLPYSQLGWFQTAQGDALDVNLSVAQQVGIQIVWCPV